MAFEKTINLTGTEVCVKINGKNCDVRNDSNATVYVSRYGGIAPDADEVLSVPAGQAVKYCGLLGVVYLLGTGKVQICGNNNSSPVFKYAAAPSGVGGVSGETLNIQNSAEFPLLEMKLYGKSTQGHASHGGTPLGKNLIEGSQDFSGSWIYPWTTADETYNGLVVKKNTGAWNGTSKKLYAQKGKTYTLSLYAKKDVDGAAYLYNVPVPNMLITPIASFDDTAETVSLTTEWQRVSFSFKCTESGYMAPRIEKDSEDTIFVCGYQLEESPEMTDYEPYMCAPNPSCPVPIVSVGDDGELKVQSCGKNLYEGSQDWSGTWNNSSNWTTDEELYEGLVVKKTSTHGFGGLFKTIHVVAGQTYTFSCMVRSDTEGTRIGIYWNYASEQAGIALPRAVSKTLNISTEWTQISITATCTRSGWINARVEKTVASDAYLYICGYQLEVGETATAYEPYTGSTASITSFLPLCGKDGVYDELIYRPNGTGKAIKNIRVKKLDSSLEFIIPATSVTTKQGCFWVNNFFDGAVPVNSAKEIANILCTHASATTANQILFGDITGIAQANGYTLYLNFGAEYNSVEAIKEFVSNNDVYILYRLSNPEEIELTAEEMAQLYKLYSHNGVTNIFNDEGAEMAVKYCNSQPISDAYLPIIKAAQSSDNG